MPEIDLSKPLPKKVVDDLLTRYPVEYVNHLQGLADANAQEEASEDEPEYNPADHTVDEVNDYLASASDTEKARVLDLEANGEARKGILGDS